MASLLSMLVAFLRPFDKVLAFVLMEDKET
jgi:hypothetical protein